MKCQVKASYPMFNESPDLEKLKWAVLTKCDKQFTVELKRGMRNPKYIECDCETQIKPEPEETVEVL